MQSTEMGARPPGAAPVSPGRDRDDSLSGTTSTLQRGGARQEDTEEASYAAPLRSTTSPGNAYASAPTGLGFAATPVLTASEMSGPAFQSSPVLDRYTPPGTGSASQPQPLRTFPAPVPAAIEASEAPAGSQAPQRPAAAASVDRTVFAPVQADSPFKTQALPAASASFRSGGLPAPEWDGSDKDIYHESLAWRELAMQEQLLEQQFGVMEKLLLSEEDRKRVVEQEKAMSAPPPPYEGYQKFQEKFIRWPTLKTKKSEEKYYIDRDLITQREVQLARMSDNLEEHPYIFALAGFQPTDRQNYWTSVEKQMWPKLPLL